MRAYKSRINSGIGYFPFLRQTAIGLLACFFFTQNPAVAFSSPEPVSRPGLQGSHPLTVQNAVSFLAGPGLPPELATIEQRGPDAARARGMVILLRDAHAIPQAQERLAEIVRRLSEAGIRDMGLEGASGELDSVFFRSFPDPELLRDILNPFVESGGLSGAAAACADTRVQAGCFGLENADAYRLAVNAFLASVPERENFSGPLEQAEHELEAQQRGSYGAPLLEFALAAKAFERHESGMETLLKITERILGAGAFHDSLTSFPSLETAVLALLDHEKQGALFSDEIRRVSRDLESRLSASDRQILKGKLQQLDTESLAPVELASWVKRIAGSRGISLELSGELAEAAQRYDALSRLEGAAFSREWSAWMQKVRSRLAVTPAEKTLETIEAWTARLRRLLFLSLQGGEWDAVISQKNIFPANGEIADSVQPLIATLRELESRLLSSGSPFRLFYEASRIREQIFTEVLTQRIKSASSPVILAVTGGYHTEALAAALIRQEISVAVVTPAFDRIPDEDLYARVMSGGVSWKSDLEARRGRLILNRSFFNAAARAFAARPESGFYTRSWREGIIRALAARRRLSSATFYTGILDRSVRMPGDTGAWTARVETYLQGLRDLKNENRLSPETVMGLLRGSLAMPWTGVLPLQLDSTVPESWGRGEAEKDWDKAAAGVLKREGQTVRPTGSGFLKRKPEITEITRLEARPEMRHRQVVTLENNESNHLGFVSAGILYTELFFRLAHEGLKLLDETGGEEIRLEPRGQYLTYQEHALTPPKPILGYNLRVSMIGTPGQEAGDLSFQQMIKVEPVAEKDLAYGRTQPDFYAAVHDDEFPVLMEVDLGDRSEQLRNFTAVFFGGIRRDGKFLKLEILHKPGGSDALEPLSLEGLVFKPQKMSKLILPETSLDLTPDRSEMEQNISHADKQSIVLRASYVEDPRGKRAELRTASPLPGSAVEELIRRQVIERVIEKTRLQLSDGTLSDEAAKKAERLLTVLPRLGEFGLRLARAYASLAEAYDLNPGPVQVIWTGGRLRGSPLTAKSDLDFIFSVGNPRQGLRSLNSRPFGSVSQFYSQLGQTIGAVIDAMDLPLDLVSGYGYRNSKGGLTLDILETAAPIRKDQPVYNERESRLLLASYDASKETPETHSGAAEIFDTGKPPASRPELRSLDLTREAWRHNIGRAFGAVHPEDIVTREVNKALVPVLLGEARKLHEIHRMTPVLSIGEGNMYTARLLREALDPASGYSLTLLEPSVPVSDFLGSRLAAEYPDLRHLSKTVESVDPSDLPIPPRLVYSSMSFEYTNREKNLETLKRVAAPGARFIWIFHDDHSEIADGRRFQFREFKLSMSALKLLRAFVMKQITMAALEAQLDETLQKMSRELRDSYRFYKGQILPRIQYSSDEVLLDIDHKIRHTAELYLNYVAQYAPFETRGDSSLKDWLPEARLPARDRVDLEALYGQIFSSPREIRDYFETRGFKVESVVAHELRGRTGFYIAVMQLADRQTPVYGSTRDELRSSVRDAFGLTPGEEYEVEPGETLRFYHPGVFSVFAWRPGALDEEGELVLDDPYEFYHFMRLTGSRGLVQFEEDGLAVEENRFAPWQGSADFDLQVLPDQTMVITNKYETPIVVYGSSFADRGELRTPSQVSPSYEADAALLVQQLRSLSESGLYKIDVLPGFPEGVTLNVYPKDVKLKKRLERTDLDARLEKIQVPFGTLGQIRVSLIVVDEAPAVLIENLQPSYAYRAVRVASPHLLTAYTGWQDDAVEIVLKASRAAGLRTVFAKTPGFAELQNPEMGHGIARRYYHLPFRGKFREQRTLFRNAFYSWDELDQIAAREREAYGRERNYGGGWADLWRFDQDVWLPPRDSRDNPLPKKKFAAVYDIMKTRVLKTPLIEAGTLGEISGKRVFLKDESRQQGGSFKYRGVYYEVYATLTRLMHQTKAREILRRGVKIVTQSTGNHGVATIGAVTQVVRELSARYEAMDPEFAALIRTVEPVIFTLRQLPPVKLRLMQEALDEYRGATGSNRGAIRNEYGSYEEALQARQQYLAARSDEAFYMEHGGEDIMLGHGSAGIEIADQLKEAGISEAQKVVLILPVGAGGPLGIAAALKHYRKNTQVVMVQSDRWDAFVRTLQNGTMEKNPKVVPPTDTVDYLGRPFDVVFPDGIAVDGAEPFAVDVAKAYLDAAVSVDEKRAYDASGVLLLKDLLDAGVSPMDARVGGTTALTAEALLSFYRRVRAIRDADAVVLFGTEGNIEPVVTDHLRLLLPRAQNIKRDYQNPLRRELRAAVEKDPLEEWLGRAPNTRMQTDFSNPDDARVQAARKDLLAWLKEHPELEWQAGDYGSEKDGPLKAIIRADDLGRIQVAPQPAWNKKHPALAAKLQRNDKSPYPDAGSFWQHSLDWAWNEKGIAVSVAETQTGRGFGQFTRGQREQIGRGRAAFLKKLIEWAESRGVLVFASSPEVFQTYYPAMRKFPHTVRENYEEPYDPSLWDLRELPLVPIPLLHHRRESFSWWVYKGNAAILKRGELRAAEEGGTFEQVLSFWLRLYEDSQVRQEVTQIQFRGPQANLERLEQLLRDQSALFGLSAEGLRELGEVLTRYRQGEGDAFALEVSQRYGVSVNRQQILALGVYAVENNKTFRTPQADSATGFASEVETELSGLFVHSISQDERILHDWQLKDRVFDGTGQRPDAALLLARGRETLQRMGIAPGDTLVDLGAGELGGFSLVGALLGAHVTAIESRKESVASLRAKALQYDEAIRRAGGSLEILEGDMLDPQVQKLLAGKRFKHVIATDVVTPSKLMADLSVKAPPAWEPEKITAILKLVGDLKSPESGSLLFSVPEFISFQDRQGRPLRYTDQIPFLQPMIAGVMKSSETYPEKAFFVSVPYSLGIKRGVLYQMKPIPAEMRGRLGLPKSELRAAVSPSETSAEEVLRAEAGYLLTRLAPGLQSEKRDALAHELVSVTDLSVLANEQSGRTQDLLRGHLSRAALGFGVGAGLTYVGAILGGLLYLTGLLLQRTGVPVEPSRFFWAGPLLMLPVLAWLSGFYMPRTMLRGYTGFHGVSILTSEYSLADVIARQPALIALLHHEWTHQLVRWEIIPDFVPAGAVEALRRYELASQGYGEIQGEAKAGLGLYFLQRAVVGALWRGPTFSDRLTRMFLEGYETVREARTGDLKGNQPGIMERRLLRLLRGRPGDHRGLSLLHWPLALISRGGFPENYMREARLGGAAAALWEIDEAAAWKFVRNPSLRSLMGRSELRIAIRQPDDEPEDLIRLLEKSILGAEGKDNPDAVLIRWTAKQGAYVDRVFVQAHRREYLAGIRRLAASFEDYFGSPFDDQVTLLTMAGLPDYPIEENHAAALMAVGVVLGLWEIFPNYDFGQTASEIDFGAGLLPLIHSIDTKTLRSEIRLTEAGRDQFRNWRFEELPPEPVMTARRALERIRELLTDSGILLGQVAAGERLGPWRNDFMELFEEAQSLLSDLIVLSHAISVHEDEVRVQAENFVRELEELSRRFLAMPFTQGSSVRSELRLPPDTSVDAAAAEALIAKLQAPLPEGWREQKQASFEKYWAMLDFLHRHGILQGDIFYPAMGHDIFPGYFGRVVGLNENPNAFSGDGSKGYRYNFLMNTILRRDYEWPGMEKNPAVESWMRDVFNIESYTEELRQRFPEGVDVLFLKGFGLWTYFDNPWLGDKRIKRRVVQPVLREIDERHLKPGGYLVLGSARDHDLADYLIRELGYEDVFATGSPDWQKVGQELAIERDVNGQDPYDKLNGYDGGLQIILGHVGIRVLRKPLARAPLAGHEWNLPHHTASLYGAWLRVRGRVLAYQQAPGKRPVVTEALKRDLARLFREYEAYSLIYGGALLHSRDKLGLAGELAFHQLMSFQYAPHDPARKLAEIQREYWEVFDRLVSAAWWERKGKLQIFPATRRGIHGPHWEDAGARETNGPVLNILLKDEDRYLLSVPDQWRYSIRENARISGSLALQVPSTIAQTAENEGQARQLRRNVAELLKNLYGVKADAAWLDRQDWKAALSSPDIPLVYELTSEDRQQLPDSINAWKTKAVWGVTADQLREMARKSPQILSPALLKFASLGPESVSQKRGELRTKEEDFTAWLNGTDDWREGRGSISASIFNGLAGTGWAPPLKFLFEPLSQSLKALFSFRSEQEQHGIIGRVTAAYYDTPQHLFLKTPSGNSYLDAPLEGGPPHKYQFPSLMAYMLAVLDLQPQDNLLIAGAGSGWYPAWAALLAGKVDALEENHERAKAGFDNVRLALRDHQVSYFEKDPVKGLPERAPYRAILVPLDLQVKPEALLQQLSPEGGRMLALVGGKPMYYVRRGDSIQEQDLFAASGADLADMASRRTQHFVKSFDLPEALYKPYGDEGQVTRSFDFLDKFHHRRISRAIERRLQHGDNMKILFIGVGRGNSAMDLLHRFDPKLQGRIELHALNREEADGFLHTAVTYEAQKGIKHLIATKDARKYLEHIRSHYHAVDLQKTEQFPVPGEKFDMIILGSAVMEYITSDRLRLLEKFKASLKPGGEYFADLDYHFELRDTGGAKVDPVRFFASISPHYQGYYGMLHSRSVPGEYFSLHVTNADEKENRIPAILDYSSHDYYHYTAVTATGGTHLKLPPRLSGIVRFLADRHLRMRLAWPHDYPEIRQIEITSDTHDLDYHELIRIFGENIRRYELKEARRVQFPDEQIADALASGVIRGEMRSSREIVQDVENMVSQSDGRYHPYEFQGAIQHRMKTILEGTSQAERQRAAERLLESFEKYRSQNQVQQAERWRALAEAIYSIKDARLPFRKDETGQSFQFWSAIYLPQFESVGDPALEALGRLLIKRLGNTPKSRDAWLRPIFRKAFEDLRARHQGDSLAGVESYSLMLAGFSRRAEGGEYEAVYHEALDLLKEVTQRQRSSVHPAETQFSAEKKLTYLLFQFLPRISFRTWLGDLGSAWKAAHPSWRIPDGLLHELSRVIIKLLYQKLEIPKGARKDPRDSRLYDLFHEAFMLPMENPGALLQELWVQAIYDIRSSGSVDIQSEKLSQRKSLLAALLEREQAPGQAEYLPPPDDAIWNVRSEMRNRDFVTDDELEDMEHALYRSFTKPATVRWTYPWRDSHGKILETIHAEAEIKYDSFFEQLVVSPTGEFAERFSQDLLILDKMATQVEIAPRKSIFQMDFQSGIVQGEKTLVIDEIQFSRGFKRIRSGEVKGRMSRTQFRRLLERSVESAVLEVARRAQETGFSRILASTPDRIRERYRKMYQESSLQKFSGNWWEAYEFPFRGKGWKRVVEDFDREEEAIFWDYEGAILSPESYRKLMISEGASARGRLFAYQRLMRGLKPVLDLGTQRTRVIYPFMGADVVPALFWKTEPVNRDTDDWHHGSGFLSKTFAFEDERAVFDSANLVLSASPRDALKLDTYRNIVREPGETLVFVLKGFYQYWHAQNGQVPAAAVEELLRGIFGQVLQPGDRLLVLDQEDTPYEKLAREQGFVPFAAEKWMEGTPLTFDAASISKMLLYPSVVHMYVKETKAIPAGGEPRTELRTLTDPLLPDVLRELGIRAEDYKVLIYPAAGNYDGSLMARLKYDVFPNLQEFHLNSMSYDPKYGGAGSGQRVKENLLHWLRQNGAEQGVGVEIYDEDYYKVNFRIQDNRAPRIWIDKGPGRDASMREDPRFYLGSLRRGIVRPGDLVLTVPYVGTQEAAVWAPHTLARRVLLPEDNRFYWQVAVVTQGDLDAALAAPESLFRTELRVDPGAAPRDLSSLGAPVYLLDDPAADLVRALVPDDGTPVMAVRASDAFVNQVWEVLRKAGYRVEDSMTKGPVSIFIKESRLRSASAAERNAALMQASVAISTGRMPESRARLLYHVIAKVFYGPEVLARMDDPFNPGQLLAMVHQAMLLAAPFLWMSASVTEAAAAVEFSKDKGAEIAGISPAIEMIFLQLRERLLKVPADTTGPGLDTGKAEAPRAELRTQAPLFSLPQTAARLVIALAYGRDPGARVARGVARYGSEASDVFERVVRRGAANPSLARAARNRELVELLKLEQRLRRLHPDFEGAVEALTASSRQGLQENITGLASQASREFHFALAYRMPETDSGRRKLLDLVKTLEGLMRQNPGRIKADVRVLMPARARSRSSLRRFLSALETTGIARGLEAGTPEGQLQLQRFLETHPQALVVDNSEESRIAGMENRFVRSRVDMEIALPVAVYLSRLTADALKRPLDDAFLTSLAAHLPGVLEFQGGRLVITEAALELAYQYNLRQLIQSAA